MVSRRNVLALGVASCVGRALTGCVNLKDLQPNCAIDFAPSLLSPVFYGFKDYAEPAVRVYYPSLDGSPQAASILQMCERFPLVILIHGDCSGDVFTQWISLPAQLARSGYVVAVTSFGGKLATGDPADTAPLRDVHSFMRSGWEFRDRLLPTPKTAVIGHSFGATLGAQLVTEIPVTAYASLSGVFGQLPNPTSVLSKIPVPSLYTWNTIDDLTLGAVLLDPNRPPAGQMWFAAPPPKHGVVFHGANHGDYMASGTSPRCAQQGPCSLVRLLAADFVTAFIAKYLSPEYAFTAFTWVPDSLFVRPQNLPAPSANGFYAGSYLQGFAVSKQSQSSSTAACTEDVMWETASSTGSAFVVPA